MMYNLLYSKVYSKVFSTMKSQVLGTIYRMQAVGCSSRNKSAKPATLTFGYSLLCRTVYTAVYSTVYSVVFSTV